MTEFVENKEQKENKKAVAWLTLGHGITDCYSGFINPILPFVVAKIGVTLTVAACALSVAQLFSSMMQPVFGYFADKWRKRFFIFWGLLMSSTFLSMSGIVQNIYQLALCLVIGGVGVGFYHPQATGLIIRYSGENTAKDMSIFIAAGTVGFSLGPVVSSGITGALGLEHLPVAAIFGLLFAFSVFLFVPRVKVEHFVENKNSFKKTLFDILGNKIVRLLIMVSALKSLITSGFSVLLPFWWKDIGYSPFQIGIAMFLFLTVGAMGTYLSAKLEKIVGYKKIFYVSLIVPFFLAVLFLFSVRTYPMMSFILFIMIGFITMLSTSVNMVLAQKTMPKYKSMISGFIGGFSWGVVGVMLPLIGFVAERITIPNTLLLISAIPFILSYLLKYLPEKSN